MKQEFRLVKEDSAKDKINGDKTLIWFIVGRFLQDLMCFLNLPTSTQSLFGVGLKPAPQEHTPYQHSVLRLLLVFIQSSVLLHIPPSRTAIQKQGLKINK